MRLRGRLANPLDSGVVPEDNDVRVTIAAQVLSRTSPLSGAGRQEIRTMHIRPLQTVGALMASASVLLFLIPTDITAQDRVPVAAAKVSAAAALMTPWGEPDLQGIWTVESDTPLQRP